MYRMADAYIVYRRAITLYGFICICRVVRAGIGDWRHSVKRRSQLRCGSSYEHVDPSIPVSGRRWDTENAQDFFYIFIRTGVASSYSIRYRVILYRLRLDLSVSVKRILYR